MSVNQTAFISGDIRSKVNDTDKPVALNRIELGFESVGFYGGRRTGEPENNPRNREKKTNNKLN